MECRRAREWLARQDQESRRTEARIAAALASRRLLCEAETLLVHTVPRECSWEHRSSTPDGEASPRCHREAQRLGSLVSWQCSECQIRSVPEIQPSRRWTSGTSTMCVLSQLPWLPIPILPGLITAGSRPVAARILTGVDSGRRASHRLDTPQCSREPPKLRGVGGSVS
jgi:hypothetical protein